MKLPIVISSIVACMSFVFYTNVSISFPEYWPEPVYQFQNNKLTKEKIQLGRALFYDPILSKDLSTSCASCHSPFNAFAHTDHDLSHGIDDQIGIRNAPSLSNLAWHTSFMWDGAINHLDMQALAPITDSKEMGESLDSVIRKLQTSKIYPPLFYEAFQDSIVTGEHVLKSIAQFQLTLVSSNAKYDFVKGGESQFTEQEQNGYELFKTNCNSCHTEPLFTNHSFKDNGLPIDHTLNDFGRMGITENEEDKRKFKVPSLRNISYTYPYMHDGRFNTLSEVLKHYGCEQKTRESRDESLKALVLSSNERIDLISFLLTLNDSSFVFNPDFQFPKEILLPSKK